MANFITLTQTFDYGPPNGEIVATVVINIELFAFANAITYDGFVRSKIYMADGMDVIVDQTTDEIFALLTAAQRAVSS